MTDDSVVVSGSSSVNQNKSEILSPSSKSSRPAPYRPKAFSHDEDADGEADDVVVIDDSPLTLGTGKVAEDTAQGLSRLLSNRMDRKKFEQKFMQRDFTGENLYNRSLKLDALLASRPSASRLAAMNVLKHSPLPSPSGGASKSSASGAFGGFGSPGSGSGSNGSSAASTKFLAHSLVESRTRLEQQQKKDRLSNLILQRPDRTFLEKKGILQAIDETSQESETLSDSNNSISNSNNDKVESGVVKSSFSSLRDRRSSAIAILSSFLSARVQPDRLIEQKILLSPSDDEEPAHSHVKENTHIGNVLVPTFLNSLHSKNVKCVGVSTGFSHTCLLDSSGQIYIFGASSNGRLGLGKLHKRNSSEADSNSNSDYSSTDTHLPRVITSLSAHGPVSNVSCGDNHSAAVINGELFTWGMGSWGRLGTGEQLDVYTPQKISFTKFSPDEKVKSVSCGAYHTVIVSTNGSVYTFGWNQHGRCGIINLHQNEASLDNNENKNSTSSNEDEEIDSATITVPRRLTFPESAQGQIQIDKVDASSGFTIALSTTGKIFTWGTGSFGALGHGDENDQWSPKLVEALKDQVVTHIAAGATHSLVRTEEGKIFSWGNNAQGQLGREQNSFAATPGLVDLDGGEVSFLAAGKAHSALINRGVLYTWGNGSRGVLGLGSESNAVIPTPVSIHSDFDPSTDSVVAVDGSWLHTVIVTKLGKVFSFGNKQYGKLGF